MTFERGMRCGVLVTLAAAALPAWADPTIVVGTNTLQANTAGQTVNVYVYGGDDLQNVDFNVQIGDGGTAFGGTNAPKLTNVNLFPTGGLFTSNNTGRTSGTTNGLIGPGGAATSASQIGYEGTITNLDGMGNPTYVTPPVSAPGALLAQLTIDTVGFTSGTWALLLTGTLNGDTAFMDDAGADYLPTAITNGSILISSPVRYKGDFNGDGKVDDGDYTWWADHYGKPKPPGWIGPWPPWPVWPIPIEPYVVSDADYTVWADNFGKQNAYTPEPASLSLLLLGGLALRRRRERVS